MKHLYKLVLAVTLLGLPQLACAATVNVQSGQVFVDRGQGYVQVALATDVKPGDIVMTMVGGTGVIDYGDGCQQSVDVGSIVVVSENSPCLMNNPQGPDYTLIVGGVAVAAGVGVAIGLSGGNDKPASK